MHYKPRYYPGDQLTGRYTIYQAVLSDLYELAFCLDNEKHTPYAVKVLQANYVGNTDMYDAFQHFANDSLKIGKHPNIVQCFSLETHNEEPLIVTEWVPHIDGYSVNL